MPHKRDSKQGNELLIGEGLPDYKRITPERVRSQIPVLLKELNDQFNHLESDLEFKIGSNKVLTWDEIMTPLQSINERLRWGWGVVNHLNGVANSNDLREAHAIQQPEVIRFSNRVGQSKTLYIALSQLKENKNNQLNLTQLRIISSELLSMNQRGVGLDGEDKEEFNSDSEKLAELSTTFGNHVLDATKEWSLLLTKPSEVAGIPLRVLEVLAAAAQNAGVVPENKEKKITAEKGPWLLGLDMPRFIPFMTYAKERKLREILYREHVSRASKGLLNNKNIIEKILSIREQQAKRLGYSNWAEVSLASKMANNIDEVERLLEEIRLAAIQSARKELKALELLANKEESTNSYNLQPWDIAFWSERLKQKEFDLNQEELRPWFPLPQVLKGLFDLCERLFSIKIEEANGQAPVWNEDVLFFKLKNEKGEHIASFYLDPYSRPSNKRGGAWMDECLPRHKNSKGETVLPIAYLVCNQTPPVGDIPSLMSFEEVETLFHEFGHGLQHMLTTVDYPQAAGINNVEWDAVELPSQFMENWCLDRKTFMGMAKHWESGESLPEKEYQKLRKSKLQFWLKHFTTSSLRAYGYTTPLSME